MKRVMFVCKKNSRRSQMAEGFAPEDYDAVISLCGCGVNLPEAWVLREVFQDWQLDDPEGEPIETFHRVREKIKGRVASLLTKVGGTSNP